MTNIAVNPIFLFDVGVTNPCDGHGLGVSHVTPLHITNVETL